MEHSLTFTPEAADRLDRALLVELQKEYPQLSRAALKRWFQSGSVLLNGKPATPALEIYSKLSYTIKILGWDPGTLASVEAAVSPDGCFLPVVYEDEDLFVLHKLSGIPSVPQKSGEAKTAVGAALAHFPELRSVGRGGYEPGILHRLDTGTSGLLVFAKHEEEFARLKQAWSSGQVQKTYRAIVRPPNGPNGGNDAEESRPREPAFELPLKIDHPMAHDAKSARRMVVLDPSRARKPAFRGKPLPARTWIHRFHKAGLQNWDFEIQIETGVMHQIRAHLSHFGWPILGDSIYRGLPSRRLWLHAWKLDLRLRSGVRLSLHADLPAGWPGTSPRAQ